VEEGIRATVQLTDVDEVEIGMPVEMVTDRLSGRRDTSNQ